MKRLLLASIAGAVLAGLMTSQAMADRTDKPQENATSKEIASFLRELHRTRADLALAQASVFGTDWREKHCRFQSLERPTWTQREEDLTAACVVQRLGPISGGLAKLMAVGECESHWFRLANNGGRYLGLFQHAAPYWSSRTSLIPRWWRVGNWDSVWNSRAQIIVTVRMVKASGGWGAWGCA